MLLLYDFPYNHHSNFLIEIRLNSVLFHCVSAIKVSWKAGNLLCTSEVSAPTRPHCLSHHSSLKSLGCPLVLGLFELAIRM